MRRFEARSGWTVAPWRRLPTMALAGAWLVLAACTPSSGDSAPVGDDTAEPTPGDTSPPPVVLFEDIQVELSEDVPTVAVLRWSTVGPATCQVTFGAEDGPLSTTTAEQEASTEHEAVLVGVSQNQDVAYTIAAEADSGSSVSEPGSYRTGELTTNLYDVRLLVEPEQGRDDRVYLFPTFDFAAELTRTDGAVSLVNGAGEYLWSTSAGFVPRARLAPDGEGVLFLSQQSDDEEGYGRFLREVSWTGELLYEQEVPEGQRDFAVLDDETIAILAEDLLFEGSDDEGDHWAHGDGLQLVHRDGTIEQTWSVFDQLAPGWCPGLDPDHLDWSHGNHLTWLEDQGLLLIVLRSFPAIVAVDPWTGEQAWVLADACGDFEIAGEGPLLMDPHSVEPTEDGLLIFNQGENPQGCSGVVEVEFDPAEPVVRPLWSWEDPSCRHTHFMGNAQPLAGGTHLVTMSGLVREIAPDGEVVHELVVGIGGELAYVEQVEGLYP